MKIYTESLSCRRKNWYTWTVLLRLVFLDNEYSSEVSQTPHFCWHYPIFVTSHEKSRSSRPELFYKKRCFWKFRKPKVFSCEFPENFQEHLFSRSTSGDCFWKYKSRSSRPEVFYKKVFFKISQNKLNFEFCEFFKNTFFHRILLLAFFIEYFCW